MLRANLAPEDTPESLFAGDRVTYVWGRSDYTDAFGESRFVQFKIVQGQAMAAGAWAIGPYTPGYEAN